MSALQADQTSAYHSIYHILLDWLPENRFVRSRLVPVFNEPETSPSEPEWLVLRSFQLIAASDSCQLPLVQSIWADDHLKMASFDATGKPEKLDFLGKTENQSRGKFRRHVS